MQEKNEKIATLTLRLLQMQQNNADLDRDGILNETGVVFSTIQRWKAEETKPSPRDVASIAKYAREKMKERLLVLSSLVIELTALVNEQANE